MSACPDSGRSGERKIAVFSGCFRPKADIYAFVDVSHAGEIIVTQWPASISPAIGTPILDQV
jgi:hypothetical protein